MDEKEYKFIVNPWVDLGSLIAVSVATGVGIGYILWGRPKRYKLHSVPQVFDISTEEVEIELVEEEEEEPTESVVAIIESEDQETVDFIADKIKESMTTVHEVEEREKFYAPRNENIFAQDDADWDYEAEVESRSQEAPYVIHKDEFWAEEMNYTQTTLTYYAGDNIMADEDDTPVYNYELITGPLKFGHGSQDPNVFHVRNEKRRAEYEILYHTGMFSSEVLGLDIEDNQRVKNLKHSTNRNRKFRDTD